MAIFWKISCCETKVLPVGGVPVRRSVQDLRRHVGQRAADGPRALVTAKPFRQPEVAHLE